jgi:uncharacterized membrane protein YfcA
MLTTVLLVGAALVTSTVSGVVGMAGGAMLLGVMVVLGIDPLLTVPIHAAVQLISNGSRAFAHAEHVDGRAWGLHVVAALPCPIVGMWLVERLDRDGVRAVMAAVILYAVWAPKWGLRSLPDRIALPASGAVAGTLGVVVGAVGPLIAPFFLRPRFDKRRLIATQAACTVVQHLIKLAAFAGLYPAVLAREPSTFRIGEHLALILPMGAAAIGGTYLGRWFLGRLPERSFVLLYKGVLTLLALRMGAQSVGF